MRHTSKHQSKQSIITNRINPQQIIQKQKIKFASTRHKQITKNKITITHVGVGEGPFIDDSKCSAGSRVAGDIQIRIKASKT